MYCSKCGKEIDNEAVVCPMCGVATQNFNDRQQNQQPQVVINNANTNANTNTNVNAAIGIVGRVKNKWIALLLCLFLGCFGAHKFYEGKIGMGVLYLFTGGIFLSV